MSRRIFLWLGVFGAACDSGGTPAIDSSQADGAAIDAPGVDAPGVDADPPGLLGVMTYLKASNTGAGDRFGHVVAISRDGETLAVGAPGESSDATGIDGDQASNAALRSGAVYVFVESAGSWTQQAYVKPFDTDVNDEFGYQVALSGDGTTLAVGATYESSCGRGVDGASGGESCGGSGAVYVFARSGITWSQQAYLKASNTGLTPPYTTFHFGDGIALSEDGNTLAVGAPGEPSGSTGINGNQMSNTQEFSGAVYVFTRSGSMWSEQAYVKASNTGIYDTFGVAVALSGDGNVMAVGASGEDSAATGIGGSQSDNGASDAGALYVFRRTGSIWVQEAYAKASNTDANDAFGATVDLSAAGTTLIVGAVGESSGATGVNGDQTDDSQLMAGAAYALTYDGTGWSQQAYLKGAYASNGYMFGAALSLSADGDSVAVGAQSETPVAPAIPNVGASHVSRRIGGQWGFPQYLTSPSPDSQDGFAAATALAGDGERLAIGVPLEDSAASGIGGDATNDSAPEAGAVYIVD